MANTFKNAFAELTDTNQGTVYTAPSGSGNVGIIIGLLLTNNDASNDTSATVSITDSSDSSNEVVILKDVTIPKNTALEVCRGNKFVLMASDVVKVTKGSSGSGLNVTLSTLEIT